MRRVGFGSLFLALSAAALFGVALMPSCGDDTGGTGGAGGGGGTGGAGGVGGTNCGGGGAGGAVSCNSLQNGGPVVQPVAVIGTAPTPLGGTVLSGTYYLTAVTFYNTAFSGNF